MEPGEGVPVQWGGRGGGAEERRRGGEEGWRSGTLRVLSIRDGLGTILFLSFDNYAQFNICIIRITADVIFRLILNITTCVSHQRQLISALCGAMTALGMK